MSVSKLNMFLKVNLPSAEIKNRVEDPSGQKYEQLQNVINYLKGLESGTEAGIMVLEVGAGMGGATSASGEVTVSGSGAQSVTINGQALTGGSDYAIANLSASEIASNIVRAITDSQNSRIQSVYARAEGSVVVVEAKSAGTVGNLISLAASGAAAASVAALEGGAEGSQRIIKFNLNS